MSATLSVSVVTYKPDLAILGATLRTLAAALDYAVKKGSLGHAEVGVVDNGPGQGWKAPLEDLVRRELHPPIAAGVLSGHGNVGYGRGNNLVLLASRADFHLVVNPDVALDPAAIDEAIAFMQANPGVLILAPDARDDDGEPLYLCKRYPSVIDLAVRGFAPSPVKRWFRASLERYEMRDLPRDRPSTAVPLLSGSFMFCRRAPVAEIGAFSDEFFLYFEDFDLSLRAAKRGSLAWVPAVRITHWGGHAARKGVRHWRLFFSSAVKFFNRHGWKWA